MSDADYLKQAVTQKLIQFCMEDTGTGIEQAMRTVADSRTLALLMDERTGLYRESPAYTYEYLKEEVGR